MSPRRRAAFTLIEMLAVVLIIGLVAGIVLPEIGFTSAQALDDHARRLSADLEFARQRTVMTGIPHRVLLDLDAGTWRVEWQPEPEEDSAEPDGEVETQFGRREIDLSPPARAEGEFTPLPSAAGRSERLEDGIAFAAVETDREVVDRERVAVGFEADGTADPARIILRDADGYGRVLEVRPLADAVRVFDEPA